MHWRVVAATTLLVGGSIWQASASGMSRSAHPAAHDLHRRDASLNDQLGRSANRMMKRLDRRQQPDNGASEPAASTLPQSGQASQLDLQAWNDATSESCMAAVAAMSEASNPSGITVCYNVPFLDNSTGVFEAELRLYNVSPPFDDWAGVRLQDISVSLSYLGAEVQATENNFNRRSVVPSSLQKRQERSGPQPLKVLTYVGRINRDLIGPAMNAAQLQPLLVPEIALVATSPGSQEPLRTTLSSTEASFVMGVFSDQSATMTDAEAQASAAAAIAAAAPLPGLTLGIVPVGMYITIGWTVLFLGAVGWGTFGRMQFREQYRRRIKRDIALGVRTI